jgi:hypothetical protein
MQVYVTARQLCRSERLRSERYVSLRRIRMSKKKHRSLKAESLVENKELGLERSQEMFDTIFAVLRQHNIDEKLWLTEYLQACGVVDSMMGNGVTPKPPADFERFLPWNMSDDMRARLQRRTLIHL